MRHTIAFLVFLSVAMYATAREWVTITDSKPGKVETTLVSGNPGHSIIKFNLSGYERTRVATPLGNAFIITVPGSSYILEAGQPDLPKLTASLMIPAQDEMAVRVISSKYMDFDDILIAPSKGNLTRDINPSTIPYSFGKAYDQSGFYPSSLASLQEPYILRDFRGQALWVYPFQYEASTRTLRVYYELTIEVYSTGNTGYNVLPASPAAQVNREFHHIYSRHFLNYGQAKYTPLADYGNMLIISHGAYMTSMQSLVEWKNMSGISTQIVDVATIGTTSAAIKTYVQNYYNTQGLTFLLLVGDAMHIPTINATSGHSDNSYGYLVGNDSYPEVFVGRFSAESLLDVETQVMRTIDYERYPSSQAGHYGRAIGIASDEGPGDDNEMDWQHVRNMLTDLLGYTYTHGAELYEGSQGGNDQPGNPTSAMLTTELHNGSGVILYTGHGSTTSFSTTGFSNSHVNALNNPGMLPFIWSVACVNGNFVNNTCFAEAWMRARSSDLPAGAVAVLMSTINQSWNPPMEGQDEMVDILVESYANNIKRTYGGISMNGCMKMNDTYGGAGTEMTDTWNLFGDPSLMVRTDTPQVFTATHLPTLMLGTSQLSILTSLTEGRATLSHNGQIISTLPITGAITNITFNPLLALDTLTLVITAYNKIPYVTEIPVIPAAGPYVIYSQHQVDDAQGNQNGLPDYGEAIQLNMSLQNLGVDPATMISALLQTNDPYITLINPSNTWGNIPAGDTVMLQAAFGMQIASHVPDQHNVLFSLTVSDTSGNSWTSSFTMKLHAPAFAFGSMLIDDQAGGNGNGLADPGETLLITIPTLNNGHSQGQAGTLLLASASPHISIDTNMLTLPGITEGGQQASVFTIHIDTAMPLGSSIDLHAFLHAGAYQLQKTYYIPVGIFSEDFETGDFSQFSWTFGGSSNWIITTQTPYQGSFSARSGPLPNNAASELVITMDVLINDSISFYRKVSSESGYDFLEFYIDNTKLDQWSGEAAWARTAYPVQVGTRTFKWRYVKDFMIASGSDRAWLDEIVFPPVNVGSTAPLQVSALAFPTTLCEGDTTQLQAVVSIPGSNLSYTWSPATGLDNAAVFNPKASPATTTTYTVTVTDGNVTASASIIVNVMPRPATPVVTVFGPDLTSNATAGNQWYDSLGAIPGAMTQVYTPPASGQYHVQVMGSNGCISLPSNVIAFTWTSIEEIPDLPLLSLYPNPATREVTLLYVMLKPGKVAIRLLDITGNTVRLLHEGIGTAGQTNRVIKLEGISRGMYMICLQGEDWQASRKLVIQ